MRAYTHGGCAHRQRVSTAFLTRKKLLCFLRDSNPRHLDLQSNALTTEPTRHPFFFQYIITFICLSFFCTNPISVFHILLECPITTALFKKDGYDFTSCNNVIHILDNTDVISSITKLTVHSHVGKVIITLVISRTR